MKVRNTNLLTYKSHNTNRKSMASNVWKFCISNNLHLRISSNISISVRNGHHMRGKPPETARSLEQRLAELNYKDPDIYYRVDIGLPHASYSRSEQLWKRVEVAKANRKNLELEKLARTKQLKIDMDETKREWLNTAGQYQIKEVADHYGIYEHLFGDAYFIPRVPLNVLYDVDKDKQLPVYYGNVIKPSQAAKMPEVTFTSDENSLWTLILTNPDGHFNEKESEYVHWFVGNIPGNSVEKGETIVEYLQPFPAKGTGYHRLIFVLYKQEQKIDFSTYKKEGPCLTLSERTFKTLDFYRPKQDVLTPAGLAFFQSDWDRSLTDFYHKTLNMKEPVFEYDFPKPYLRPQEWFPKRKPFNIYMDKYRDPKQINKEFLVRKLKNVHPFKPTPPPLPYPNAVYFEGYVPSWLKLEMTKSRLKWGRVNDIE